MSRVVLLGAAALLVFIALLLARFPARWAAGWLPETVQCQRLTGTIWSGRCTALTLEAAPLGDARWNIRASRLLAGKLAAAVTLTKPGVDIRADVEAAPSGTLTARNVSAVVPLDAGVLPQVPPNLRGTVRADLKSLALSGRTITSIEGRIDAVDLAQVGRNSTELGDYSVTFPPTAADSEPVGTLVDLRGPLNVTGSLRLTREPGFVLDGLVAARPDASPELARQLQYLGAPDAAGRRPFSIAGTF
ncbi:MAG: type II secretion system protein N [Steroidobacteraceae bacterium]